MIHGKVDINPEKKRLIDILGSFLKSKVNHLNLPTRFVVSNGSESEKCCSRIYRPDRTEEPSK